MVESHERQPATHLVQVLQNLPRMVWVLAIWGAMVGSLALAAVHYQLHPMEILHAVQMVAQTHPAGPLIFFGLALASPLLLIPAALLGTLAGAWYDPFAGVLYTLIGCNLSGMLMYGLGRLSHQADGMMTKLAARYGERLHRHGFMSVLLLRLSFLPYDPINYLIGLLRVPWPTFLLANTLGSLPGVVAIVAAGAAIGQIGKQETALLLVGMSLGLILLSVGVAILVRRRDPA
jgi:uncharacterized membrane protein YdjX (TVP38/TMEM64 family)